MTAKATTETRSRLARVRTALRHTPVLLVRAVRDSIDDRLPGLAAEVSFFVLLSLPPLLLVGLGALGYVGDVFGDEAVVTVEQQIIDGAGQVLTPDTVETVVRPAIAGLLANGRAHILSLGALLALWSASRALRVVVQAITIAYDVEDHRSWWQHRLLGLGLTLGGVLLIAILLPLLVVGPEAGGALAGRFGLEQAFEVTWRALYFPVVVALGLSVLTWVYHIVPQHKTLWRRDLPGAVLALVLWLLGSLGLRIYATQTVGSESAYAYFGTPLVLMLWIYVTSFTFLLGAELNSEIAKAGQERDTAAA
jgi:membrane protein